MILQDYEIYELIEHPANEDQINRMIEVQKEHDIHVTGKKFESLIDGYDGLEKPFQLKLKKKVATPISKSLVNQIIKDASKFIHATDTVKYYNFIDNEKELNREFQKILSKVWKNQSIQTFVSNFMKTGIWNKFNDFLYVEYPYIKEVGGEKIMVKDGVVFRQFSDEDMKPCINHIPIQKVHDVFIYGEDVEYIIIKGGKEKVDGREVDMYIVLDDYGCRIVYDFFNNSNRFEIVERIESTLEKLPVVKVFPFPTSLLQPELENLNTLVQDNAVMRLSRISHAYPQRATPGVKCRYQDVQLNSTVCDGSGYIQYTKNDQRVTEKCPNCKGLGVVSAGSPAEDILLPAILENDQKAYLNNPINYANVDVEILKVQNEFFELQKNNIKEGIFSKNIMVENSIVKTATEVVENSEPIVLINEFLGKLVAKVEMKITDWIGKLVYQSMYDKSFIKYGTNYASKRDNEIISRITKARDAGICVSELYQLQVENINSKYIGDPRNKKEQQLLLQVEPFPTLTIEQVEKSTLISQNDKLFKLYFVNYINQLKRNGKFETIINSDNPVQILEKELNKLHNLKIKENDFKNERDSSAENEKISERTDKSALYNAGGKRTPADREIRSTKQR